MATVTNAVTQRVPATGQSRKLVVQFDRPANTTPYVARDAVSDDASTAKALEFAGSGKSGVIVGASVMWSMNKTPDLELVLFDREPTGFADGAQVSMPDADFEKVIGRYSFNGNFAKQFGNGNVHFVATLDGEVLAELGYVTDSGKLFGLLITRGGTTPTSGAQVNVTIHVRENL